MFTHFISGTLVVCAVVIMFIHVWHICVGKRHIVKVILLQTDAENTSRLEFALVKKKKNGDCKLCGSGTCFV